MLSAPPGFFLFWVRLWVKAATPQKLRHYKTKKELDSLEDSLHNWVRSCFSRNKFGKISLQAYTTSLYSLTILVYNKYIITR